MPLALGSVLRLGDEGPEVGIRPHPQRAGACGRNVLLPTARWKAARCMRALLAAVLALVSLAGAGDAPGWRFMLIVSRSAAVCGPGPRFRPLSRLLGLIADHPIERGLDAGQVASLLPLTGVTELACRLEVLRRNPHPRPWSGREVRGAPEPSPAPPDSRRSAGRPDRNTWLSARLARQSGWGPAGQRAAWLAGGGRRWPRPLAVPSALHRLAARRDGGARSGPRHCWSPTLSCAGAFSGQVARWRPCAGRLDRWRPCAGRLARWRPCAGCLDRRRPGVGCLAPRRPGADCRRASGSACACAG